MSTYIEEMFKEHNIADKADLVTFKGTMAIWPVLQHKCHLRLNFDQTEFA